MQIAFQKNDIVVTAAMREHVDRRLRFALSRFGERVRRVSVSFRGADDLQDECNVNCRVEVTVADLGAIPAEDADTDGYVAVDRAIERVARAVRRAITLLDEHKSLGRNQ